MNKKLSIVIVCYNSVRLLPDCLDSIIRYNDIADALEIILVDNQSKDRKELGELVLKYTCLDIKLYDNSHNGGYGQGNNVGVQYASAPVFVVMNPDVRLVEPVFQRMLDYLDANPETGLAGVNFEDMSSPLYLKPEFYFMFRMIFVNQLVKYRLFRLNEMYPAGSFLLVRKDAFLNAGRFDEQIFLYYEEADLATRMLAAGYRVDWLKDFYVHHLAHNRPLNVFLLQKEVDSLCYYLDKFKFNKRKFLINRRSYYQVKYLIAVLTGNTSKKEFFGAWINTLTDKIK
jgi:GT2 family glycosyltransferase